MVREPFQVTAPEPAPVKMEIPGILDSFADSDSKLGIEVLTKLMGNLIVLSQNLIQVRLNPPMKPNLQGGAARRPIRRK